MQGVHYGGVSIKGVDCGMVKEQQLSSLGTESVYNLLHILWYRVEVAGTVSRTQRHGLGWAERIPGGTVVLTLRRNANVFDHAPA